MPNDLNSLAERCERATGPDRELDGWIWARLNPDKPFVVGAEPGRFPRKPIYGKMSDVMKMINGKDGADHIGAPSYTTSLDAAMSLVPDGWHWSVYDTNGVGKANAQVEPPEYSYAPFNADGMTPALAFCAAALRARSSLTPLGE